MLGFEVTINDEKPIRITSDGVQGVAMHFGENPEYNFMELGGMDSRMYYLSWPGKDIELGDKIKICITEVNDEDPVPERYPDSRESLKKHYFQMKKELEEQGLI